MIHWFHRMKRLAENVSFEPCLDSNYTSSKNEKFYRVLNSTNLFFT